MKLNLALVSMPWAHPMSPSSQVGALKAHIDRVFGGEVRTTAHSAHLSIIYRWKGCETLPFFREFWKNGEYPYLYLLYKNFLRQSLEGEDVGLTEMIRAINEGLPRSVTCQGQRTPLTARNLKELETVTNAFADEEIIPALRTDELNVIGFTLNHYQLYSSVYLERYLRKRAPGKKLLFIYGGYIAGAPLGVNMLRRLGATGLRVVGEGEKKLEAILTELRGLDPDSPLPETLDLNIDGVIPVPAQVDPLEHSDKNYRSQYEKLGDLALPDFDEYFEKVRTIKQQDYISAKYNPFALLVEGSRGCFARCDFCSLNSQWKGFRKFSAEEVYARTFALIDRHGNDLVYFLDNVCDTWAEGFAELVIERGRSIRYFMELRAHHPETFWTKLAISGMQGAQIGVEAISEPLLRKIGKGTYTIQNLRVQKYLGELGIHSGSNLIAYHPKSTVADVEETKRILMLTPHFPRLSIVTFWLDIQSPIFNSLSPEDRKSLIPFKQVELGGKLSDIDSDGGFKVPLGMAPSKEVTEAWDELLRWEFEEYAKFPIAQRLSSARLHGGAIAIEDRRYGRNRKRVLEGSEALIYDFCHSGPTLATLEKLGSGKDEMKRLIDGFIDEQLMIRVENSVLSLALRPREELIANLYSKHPVLRRPVREDLIVEDRLGPQ